MREICQSGSEGGGSRTQSVLPTPISVRAGRTKRAGGGCGLGLVIDSERDATSGGHQARDQNTDECSHGTELRSLRASP